MQVQVEPGAPAGTKKVGQEPANDPAGGAGAGPATPPTDPPGKGAAPPSDPPKDTPPEADDPKWDDKTKAYIQKLRGESAKNRTKAANLETSLSDLNTRFGTLESGMKKALGLESEELTQDNFDQAAAQSEQLEFENALLQSAIENKIPSDKIDFFKFKITSAVANLKESEELSDEAYTAIVSEVMSLGGEQAPVVKDEDGNVIEVNENSSVKTPKTPAPNTDGLTVEQFVKMTLSEKSALYGKNQSQYDALVKEAKEKDILV